MAARHRDRKLVPKQSRSILSHRRSSSISDVSPPSLSGREERLPGDGRELRRQTSTTVPPTSTTVTPASTTVPPTFPPPARQRTRTISVPAGLKLILNDLSKEVIYAQPKNIPLYCAQLLEQRLEERRKLEIQENESNNKEKEEKETNKTEEEENVQTEKEEFRKKIKHCEPAVRSCESQTGFTTDSGDESIISKLDSGNQNMFPL